MAYMYIEIHTCIMGFTIAERCMVNGTANDSLSYDFTTIHAYRTSYMYNGILLLPKDG